MTDMKIPIKYGLIITLGVVTSMVITNVYVPRPSPWRWVDSIFSHVWQFAILYLGLKAKEREYGDKQDFKKALKTGVSISFVYALTACLALALVYAFARRSLVGEVDESYFPGLLALALAGFFVGSMVLGLFYSAVISFFLAKRQNE